MGIRLSFLIKSKVTWIAQKVVPFSVLFFTLLCNFSDITFAISENHYLDGYFSEVFPFFKNGSPHYFVSHGFFVGKDNIKIAYRTFEVENEKGALVILPGRSVPIINYAETIYDLNDLNLSVYILDHRGQGSSDKMIPNSQVQYVKNFDDYVDDLSKFMKTIVRPSEHSRLYLMTDSMGGAIGTLFMMKYPYVFDAAVLSVPMFGINTGPFTEPVAIDIAKNACKVGLCEKYMITQSDYRPTTAAESVLTRSDPRLAMVNLNYLNNPETIVGGASYQWFLAAEDAMNLIRSTRYGTSIPTLIVQAERDIVVKNKRQKEFCKRSKDCRLAVIPGAYHGIFIERDSVRNQALDEIRSFLGAM